MGVAMWSKTHPDEYTALTVALNGDLIISDTERCSISARIELSRISTGKPALKIAYKRHACGRVSSTHYMHSSILNKDNLKTRVTECTN